MKKISIFGIFLGMLSSIILFVASNLLMFVLFQIFLKDDLVAGIPLLEFTLLYLTIAVGISSFTGGYIATRIANNRSYANSIIFSVLMIFYFVFLGTIRPDPEMGQAIPGWMGILDCFVIILSALLGGFSRIRKGKKV
jgi:hypothetical protein